MSNALEIRHLVKRFGGLTATNDLSFDLAIGESLGLIGPNGAGKTTIFSQIMGETSTRAPHGSRRTPGGQQERLLA